MAKSNGENMIKIGTKCSECQFYKNRNCSLNLFQFWEEAGAKLEHTDDDTIIDRVCLYRRTNDWMPELSDEEKSIQVYQEVYISGTIVLFNSNRDFNGLKKSLEEINKLEELSRFRVLVCVDEKSELFEVATIVKQTLLTKDFYVIKVCDVFNPETASDEAFRKAKNGFIFFLDSSKPFDVEIFDIFNTAVNFAFKRVLFVDPGDSTLHKAVCLAPLFKMLKGNKAIDGKEPILNKIREIATAQDCLEQIVTWEELYEL